MNFNSINGFDDIGYENTREASSYARNCICACCTTEGWAEATPGNPCTVTRYQDSWA